MTVFQRWLPRLAPSSVVDFGCGSGAWLRAAKEFGVVDLLGLDGSWAVPLDEIAFRMVDLSRPVQTDKVFDLGVCVEVAEHLPESAADTLVASIVASTEMVLWSAATPGQGGHGHINEQPPEYWAQKFAQHGWVGRTTVRQGLVGPVEWWYAQNLMIYAPKDNMPNLLKIAVYAPAKNEAHNIEAWAASAAGADEIVLVDTGSDDETVKIASEHPDITVYQAVVSPWRFDDGMNAALWHVSPDIDVCICLHLDDRLEPGWREEIEKAGLAGQYTFNYKWSNELTYRHDRIHARHGYRWAGAAHEALDGPGPKVNTELWMTQHRDLSKDRSQDPGLIHLAYRENKTPRTTYYSAREHYYKDEWGPAREKFLEYLAMPDAVYDQERSEACRLLARMVWPAQKEKWLLRACSEAPQRREPWVDLAHLYVEQGRPVEATGAAARALSIGTQDASNSFFAEASAWDNGPLLEILSRSMLGSQA
jgi:hypothetical protein